MLIMRETEDDSDPEFISGVFIPEPKGRRKKSQVAHAGRKRKRASDCIKETNPTREPKSGQTAQRRTNGPNPLAKWFRQDLDVNSVSEDEEDEKKCDLDAMDDSEDGDEADEEEESDNDENMISKTFAVLTGPVDSKQRVAPENLSATESESEGDGLPPSMVSRRPAISRIQPSQNLQAGNDSVTESDSDIPVEALGRQNASKAGSDSETESDTDSEQIVDTRYYPRPGFKLESEQKLLGGLVLNATERIITPAAINTYLREYQRDGVKFFYEQYQKGLGALLGDDMGLGKTIQVISFLSAIMRKHGDVRDLHRRRQHVSELQDEKVYKKSKHLPPANATWPTCLIIAPSTVVGNWEREFETWGYFEVGIYNGNKADREEVLKDFKMGRYDVVVTSFELASRDIDHIDDLAWSLVIVDEVHRVKNSRSGTTKALHRFQSPLRFGLTGTAIQNNYGELWTILDWTNPGELGTLKQWKGYVVHPLSVGQSVKCTDEQRLRAINIAHILRDKLLPNFFKRRCNKASGSLQLPKKEDHVVFCPLTFSQITVYKRILAMDAVQNLLHKDEPCTCGSQKSRMRCCHPFDAGDMLSYMSVLIKISNHLILILPAPDDTPEQNERHRHLCSIAFPNSTAPKYGQAELSKEYCGKWDVLQKLLNKWRQDPKNKVLIFTKSRRLLDMLAFHVKGQGHGYLQLDGTVPMRKRMQMIDDFHENPEITIFLISTLAGGTGVSSTTDPNWNPAHDLQAMDRAYRFGQTRDVAVYRLLGAGSIEELIYARQIYKQQQMAIGYDASVQTRYFEGVQNDKSRQGELFGIKNIFKLHEGVLTTKETVQRIEKANISELDWAMANMESKPVKRTSLQNSKRDEVDEIDAKGDADLRGLGAFLFDDVEAATTRTRHQDDIQKELNDIGAYSHLNDAQLRPTGVEEARYAQKRRKSAVKKGKGIDASDGPPAPSWPPARNKRRPPPMSPGTKLANRQGALIELGIIHSPAHLAEFAQELLYCSVRKTEAEQTELVRRLDEHAAENILRFVDRRQRGSVLVTTIEAAEPSNSNAEYYVRIGGLRSAPARLKASLGLPTSAQVTPGRSEHSLPTTSPLAATPRAPHPDWAALIADSQTQTPATDNVKALFELAPGSAVISLPPAPAETHTNLLATPSLAELSLPNPKKPGEGLSPLIGSLELITDIDNGAEFDKWPGDHTSTGQGSSSDMYVGDHATDSLGLYSPGAAESEPLIGQVTPLAVLREEYAGNPGSFVQQVDYLGKDGYDSVRRTKPIIFAYAERALSSSDAEIAAARDALAATFTSVTGMFDPALIDELTDWYEELLSLLPRPGTDSPRLTVDVLAAELQKPEKSNPILVYIRLATSAELQSHAEEFVHFLPDYDASLDAKGNVREFCSKHVEPLGTYADDLQITALCRALQISVRIAHLDGRSPAVNFSVVGESPDRGAVSDEPWLHLLFRPIEMNGLVRGVIMGGCAGDFKSRIVTKPRRL
ncbi:hypothetical protein FIBSPDRAFT_884345 [Athelia psychrophila]|uniref:ubiquitinyl hydrolase 1 n=1 Tax=Athelia psychrophila TaxID=1759441 RepID=A0A166T0F3_9AGAM|nr:hypothetical protein FIBSPDRAFT_884345 [Fibularhizoctonia sp. CBS 109695]